MAFTADGPVMSVVLAPRAHVEDILAVLGDYSAVGMLDEFVCIDAAEVRGPSVAATRIAGGRADPVVLQQLLTQQRYRRVRVVVLVPVRAPAQARVPLAVEQTVEQIVRTASMGAPVTLLRLLLTGAGAASASADPALVLEGWHNLLIAPEDSPSPDLGTTLLDGRTDPLDVARHIAPVIAGAAGLWAGLGSTPFDRLEVLPGQTVRAVRGFYRRLDSTEIENRLRTQLFTPTGQLPLPHGGQVPVVYAEDPALAAQSMARALWTKHRDVLRGARPPLESSPAQTISIWAALKMFTRFMWAALRRAPSTWLSAMIGSVSAAAASTVQSAVFGRTDSAFAVVASPQLANWQELARSAEEMSAALEGGAEQHARADLTPLWTDFINAALTLADGGRRSTGLEPVQVGAGVGVLARCADVMPSSTEQFSAIPASLAAVIEAGSVEAVDVLGVADLRDRLHRAYADPAAGVEARHAGADLDRWQTSVAGSYGWQVAAILADFLTRARGEVSDLVGKIRSAADAISTDERLRRRQRTIALILKTFSCAGAGIVVALVAGAALAWLRWPFALTCAGALVAVYVALTLVLFLWAQRDLFAALNLRESQITQIEALQANLRSALTDLRRLSMAYGQLLAWSRALAALLRAPFGVLDAPAPPEPLLDGLPRSTASAAATPAPEHADVTLRRIQQRLYHLGWLTRPWDALLAAAGSEVRDDPQTLLTMPGSGSGSALDRWSFALACGQLSGHGAGALWQQAQHILADPASAIGENLTATVTLADGSRVSAEKFSAGMTRPRRDRPAAFDASLFTATALTAGRSQVLIDEPVVVQRGLGYLATVIQASEGLPVYDFVLSAPPPEPARGDAGEPTTALAPADRDTPPGDLVF
jgi:hypothetical protein